MTQIPVAAPSFMKRTSVPLFISLVTVVAVWQLTPAPATPDYQEYRTLAQNLLETGRYGFRDAWKADPILSQSQWRYLYDEHGTVRPPGYSVVLSAVIKVFGNDRRYPMILMAVLSGLTAFFVYRIGLGLWDVAAAGAAATLFALSPGETVCFTFLGREPLLTLTFSAGLMFAVHCLKTRSLASCLLAGFCFGLAGYFKETVAAAGGGFVLLMLAIAIRNRSWMLAQRSLVIIACILLTVMPWIIRNSSYYHRSTGMSMMGGTAFWLGQVEYDQALTLEDLRLASYLSKEDMARFNPYEATNVREADERIGQATKAYLYAHPGAFVQSLMRNSARFWSPVSRTVLSSGFTGRKGELISGMFYVLCFLAALATIWVCRSRMETWLLVLLLAGITAIHVPFCSYPRYRIPFEIVAFLLASGSFQAWYCHRKARSQAATGTKLSIRH